MRGIGALVRTFTGTPPRAAKARPGSPQGGTRPSPPASRPRPRPTRPPRERTYETTLGWYAACASPRVQLLSTHRVEGVGDEATLMVLRNWAEPGDHPGGRRGPHRRADDHRRRHPHRHHRPDRGARPRRRAPGCSPPRCSGLCTLPDAGGCAATPQVKDSSPVPVGKHPSLLVEADLPPVPGIDQPWVGTQPTQGQGERRRHPLRRHRVHRPGVHQGLTRTFVIPAATQLPPEFGLSRDRGRAAPQAGAGLRRRHPRQAREVPRRRPRHRRRAARPGGDRAAATCPCGGSPSRSPRSGRCAS